MSDNHTAMMKSLPADDGWSDAATEARQRVIRGTLLKFADWRWTTGKEATPVAAGTKLVALATVALWVRWQNNKPVEYRQREPNRKLPEREELGYTNEDEWELDRDGVPYDPWRNTRLVYLVDPQTAEAFTFSTHTWGGRGAVNDLGDQITRMRTVHPDAVPLVELNAGPMPTQRGPKSKPVFKVVSWKTADGGDGPAPVERQVTKPAPVERQVTKQQVEQEVRKHEMDDEIPF